VIYKYYVIPEEVSKFNWMIKSTDSLEREIVKAKKKERIRELERKMREDMRRPLKFLEEFRKKLREDEDLRDDWELGNEIARLFGYEPYRKSDGKRTEFLNYRLKDLKVNGKEVHLILKERYGFYKRGIPRESEVRYYHIIIKGNIFTMRDVTYKLKGSRTRFLEKI